MNAYQMLKEAHRIDPTWEIYEVEIPRIFKVVGDLSMIVRYYPHQAKGAPWCIEAAWPRKRPVKSYHYGATLKEAVIITLNEVWQRSLNDVANLLQLREDVAAYREKI